MEALRQAVVAASAVGPEGICAHLARLKPSAWKWMMASPPDAADRVFIIATRRDNRMAAVPESPSPQAMPDPQGWCNRPRRHRHRRCHSYTRTR